MIGSATGQQALDSQLLQFDPDNPSAASSYAKELLKKKRALDSHNGLDAVSRNKPVDSVYTDTTDSNFITDSKFREHSVYENILRGNAINPDSLLDSLPIFGYDIFDQSKVSPFGSGNGNFVPVPADYPVNAGDEIVVMLWGRINEEYRLQVNREGEITIPRIGPVAVAGQPFTSVKQTVLDRITTMEGVNASVSMGALQSIDIYIMGEVVSPGKYTIRSLSNITNALFAAGGPTKNGSLRSVQLKRNGRLIRTIDFYELLLSGKNNSTIRLHTGDVIFVPIVRGMAAIAGNVRRSALYELKGTVRLQELIDLAGGIAPSAWMNRIQVERYVDNRHQVVLDLDSNTSDIESFTIQDGDIVKVFPVIDKDKNTIYLSGNVLRPGKYEYREGIRITDIIPDFNQLAPETYFEYAVILRKEPPSFLERIVAFDLRNAIKSPETDNNMRLQPHDHIVIYNKDYFEPDRTVSIEGAINTPGKYKLLENMRIRDLVLQSGGLREDASPKRGELYRRQNIEERVTTEKHDFCVECAMRDDRESNLELQRGDRIFIRSRTGWEKEQKVVLKGQVKYPGTYVIFEGETLGELLQRAGGFKNDAYLAAAVFTRKTVKTLEDKRLTEYSRQLQSDIVKFSAELAATRMDNESKQLLPKQLAAKDNLSANATPGRIVIDLTTPTSYTNFVLEDGDELYVPRNLNTVSVIGEVYNPSTFRYQKENAKVGYYLEAAGGLKETSDKKHIYIVKANGSIVTNKMTKVISTELEPGDAVVVPQKIRYSNPRKNFTDTIDAIFKLSTVVALVVTTILKF